MITVTRLNQTTIWLNPDLIETIESTPDTVITLTSGKKLIIKETPQDVAEMFVWFKQRCYSRGIEHGQ